MGSVDDAKRIVSEVSGHDLDTWIRPSTFTHELEEVRKQSCVVDKLTR